MLVIGLGADRGGRFVGHTPGVLSEACRCTLRRSRRDDPLNSYCMETCGNYSPGIIGPGLCGKGTWEAFGANRKWRFVSEESPPDSFLLAE